MLKMSLHESLTVLAYSSTTHQNTLYVQGPKFGRRFDYVPSKLETDQSKSTGKGEALQSPLVRSSSLEIQLLTSANSRSFSE